MTQKKKVTEKGRTTPKKDTSPTSVKEWKKATVGHELRLPSGNVCLARRPGMQAFITNGTIPNSLMPMVNKFLNEGKAPKSTKDVLGGEELTPELIADMYRMFNDVVLDVVIEPKVSNPPNSEEDRDDDVLYIDEVDDEDKSFIFNWAVGGTSDLEKFRSEQAALMGSV